MTVIGRSAGRVKSEWQNPESFRNPVGVPLKPGSGRGKTDEDENAFLLAQAPLILLLNQLARKTASTKMKRPICIVCARFLFCLGQPLPPPSPRWRLQPRPEPDPAVHIATAPFANLVIKPLSRRGSPADPSEESPRGYHHRRP